VNGTQLGRLGVQTVENCQKRLLFLDAMRVQVYVLHLSGRQL